MNRVFRENENYLLRSANVERGSLLPESVG